MKTKKFVCSLMLVASAFFAYSTFNIVKAETSGTQINMSANNEVAPFSNATSLPLGQQNEIYLEDIQPAIIKEEKKEVKEVKKVQEEPAPTQEQTAETSTTEAKEETVVEEKTTEEVKETITEEIKEEPKQEVVQEEKQETTEEKTILEVKELTVQEEKISEQEQQKEEAVTEETKEEVKEEQTQEITEEVNIQEVEEVKEVKKVEEIKEGQRELPSLEDIQLPELEPTVTETDTMEIEVSSQRIPVGTVIPVKLESPINSVTSTMGDQFNATLTSDIMLNDDIILPAGSVIRGTVGKIKKSNFLLREAKIMLIFDHIVTPAGKQIPVYAYIAGNDKINYEGYVTGGSSYSKAFKADAQRGREIMVDATNFGVEKGLEYWGGAPIVLTAPFCAIGGALGGGGFIVGKSVYNMFLRGNEVTLNPGTRLNITLSRPLDIPLN